MGRIDVHAHVMAPSWVDAMSDPQLNPQRYPLPAWSPDAAVALMDRLGIATQILSLTTPGVTYWPAGKRRAAAREINEYTAGLNRRYPGRFGNFATLPIPDIAGALLEIDYVFTALRADGIVVYTNYEGDYLGNPAFEPLWAEMDKREAVVFIHPGPPKPPGPWVNVDFPADTTRTAFDIVVNGIFDRYRRVKVILPHGGGFIPYQAYRFAGSVDARGTYPHDRMIAWFQRFYFDTALTSSPAAMPCLKAFAQPSHILFGTDFPYAPGNTATNFTKMLDENGSFTQAERADINRGNAALLLPNWAPVS